MAVEKGGTRVIAVELESPEDLLRLASLLPVPFVNYSIEERVVFLPFGGIGRTGAVYYARLGEPLNSRFAHVNRLKGSVTFGDAASMEPNVVNVEIIRVRAHNIQFLQSK
ncbi:MAG: hypothetical protein NZ988_02305 [Thaumarchaeota archaeon]|nr:hypothetical protein [Candidatus Calditenuaceae archaeon]MDW8186867.1 hypothetical protein [Nitrososphaerota archaeon]